VNRVKKLYEEGQSIWLDYIERGLIQSGELQKLVEDGIAGVTSNPTIFQGAISGSDAYVADLSQLIAGDLDAKAIFEALAISDIQAATDVLRPIYERTDAVDGYVSLEVAPDLADDTQATIAEAKRLWAAVNRPNLMIKVPATVAGIPAIGELIAAGINVNVTLIFALDRYAAVKEVYLQGLEARVAAGQPVDRIASVASFFISRVDSNIDARLQSLAATNEEMAATCDALMGKAAVANAKLAYAQFQRVFDGSRWQALSGAGARVQRPLWASTSTKNPTYPELLYVETLVGPHTVNTMPPKTLTAFREHGLSARTVDQDLAQSQQVIVDLSTLGISINEVTDELEVEGVEKFAISFRDLLATIEEKRQELTATK
jgi:transaldolase